MDEEIEVGTEIVDGQPEEGTEIEDGQPNVDESQTDGQPEANTEPAETIELAQYKELQRKLSSLGDEKAEYARKIEQLNQQFGKFGGAEQAAQVAEYLAGNPDFQPWIDAQRMKLESGVDMGEMDEDTKQATDLVNKLIEHRLNLHDQALMRDKIEPIANQLKAERLQQNLDIVAKTPGFESFDDYKDAMLKLAETLPPEAQDDPSVEELKTLYLRAVVESGDIEKVMAKAHNKRLESKKKMSTDAPGSPKGEGTKTRPKNMAEAVNNAKIKLGITLQE